MQSWVTRISISHTCIVLQMYDRGKGLAFHFDKDEALMAEQRIMHQPALSSILYLTGSCQSDRLGEAQGSPCRVLLRIVPCIAFHTDTGALPASPVLWSMRTFLRILFSFVCALETPTSMQQDSYHTASIPFCLLAITFGMPIQFLLATRQPLLRLAFCLVSHSQATHPMHAMHSSLCAEEPGLDHARC